MKVFTTEQKAKDSISYKKKYYLNSYCPQNKEKLCGNWCALFKYNKSTNNISDYVVLNCKSSVRLYVDGVE